MQAYISNANASLGATSPSAYYCDAFMLRAGGCQQPYFSAPGVNGEGGNIETSCAGAGFFGDGNGASGPVPAYNAMTYNRYCTSGAAFVHGGAGGNGSSGDGGFGGGGGASSYY